MAGFGVGGLGHAVAGLAGLDGRVREGVDLDVISAIGGKREVDDMGIRSFEVVVVLRLAVVISDDVALGIIDGHDGIDRIGDPGQVVGHDVEVHQVAVFACKGIPLVLAVTGTVQPDGIDAAGGAS